MVVLKRMANSFKEGVSVKRKSEDITSESEDFTSESEDIILESEDITSESEDITSESEDITADKKRFVDLEFKLDILDQIEKATHWVAVAWDNNLDENLVRDWMKKVPEINTAIKEHLEKFQTPFKIVCKTCSCNDLTDHKVDTILYNGGLHKRESRPFKRITDGRKSIEELYTMNILNSIFMNGSFHKNIGNFTTSSEHPLFTIQQGNPLKKRKVQLGNSLKWQE